MQATRRIAAPALLLIAMNQAGPLPAAGPSVGGAGTTAAASTPATPDPPLRTHAGLAAWRAAHPGPLDRLSPTGLARFLRGLVLTGDGPATFPLADLQAELTGEDVTAVARLFGLGGTWEGLTAEESRRVARVERPVVATALERRIEAFEAWLDDLPVDATPARAAPVYARFERIFPAAGWTGTLTAASDHELLLVWRAASGAAFHGHDPRLLQRAEAALAALRRRGLDTRMQTRELQALHLARGNPAAAMAIAGAMRDRDPIRLPPLRTLDGARGHTAWDVDGDPPALVEREHAPRGRRIVVVSAPGCGFSRAAARDIAADSLLGPLFARDALWLAPPRTLADWAALRGWNRDHPQTRIQVATRASAWPELAFVQTPVFVVMEDERVLARIHGWTPARRLELEQALRTHGLLP